MAGEDKSKLIVPEGLDGLDVELRNLGVVDGLRGLRGELSWKVGEVLDRSANISGTDLMLLAVDRMRQEFEKFMAAQNGLFAEDRTEDLSNLSADNILYTKPIEFLEDGTATAVGRTMYNKRWSRYFAHSSDMMLPSGGLVEALLNEGEEVVGVESMRFLNPVQNNLELFACAGELSPDIAGRCAQRKPDLKATFLTKNAITGEQRSIKLFGFQNDESSTRNPMIPNMANLPAALSRDFNSWERDMDKDGNDVFTFDLSQPDSGIVETKVGVALNAVMELVMCSFSRVRRGSKNICPDGGYNLAYGFDFKKLPKPEQLNEECKLLISVDKAGIVEKSSGFRLIPVKFSIQKGGNVISEGVFINAQAMSDDVAWAYSDRL